MSELYSVGFARQRLLLFRTVRGSVSGFLLQHLDEHVRALEKWFDVIVIDKPCDYAKTCDEFEPDLCVFEVGVYSAKRHISNTDSHPDIPKLGFLHADSFDSSRAAFVADMAAWGVEWFFTTSMSMPSYAPELSERLFVWPNAVDAKVFKDYGQPKEIEVLVIGSQASHYPWRNAVNKKVSEGFAARTMPHFGWNAEPGTDTMLLGRDYSKLLNTSLFVPTCGTMARDVVRKHLEIPASKACLVTEDTPAIRALGFRDMENCVFAEAETVTEKLRYLLGNRMELEQITREGHDLVHSLHTFDKRDQILQWLDLVKANGTDISICQQWPSGRLELRRGKDTESKHFLNVRGRDRALLQEAWGAMEAGDTRNATSLFSRCLNYYFIPEAAVGMVFANLKSGHSQEGYNWATRALIPPLSHHCASAPDPVQWASLIRSFLCLGNLPSALTCAAMYLDMDQMELRRIRNAVYLIAQNQLPGIHAPQLSTPGSQRHTICPVPLVESAEWSAELAAMLQACGQEAYAEQVLTPTYCSKDAVLTWNQRRTLNIAKRRVDRLLKRMVKGSVQPAPERWIRRRLSPLKRIISTSKSSRALQALLESVAVDHAILVLPIGHQKVSRAVNAGLGANPGLSSLEVLSPDEAKARFDRELRELQDMMIRPQENRAQIKSEKKSLVFLSRAALNREPSLAMIATADLLLVEHPRSGATDLQQGVHEETRRFPLGHTMSSDRGWVLYRRPLHEHYKDLKEVGA